MSGAPHAQAMDDRAIGIALRTLRRRRGWRQEDLALRASVSAERIAHLEAGRLERAGLAAIRTVSATLDAQLALRLRWHGEELDRLLNVGHSRLHEVFGAYVARLPGWVSLPEVSFSIYGERGVIDVLLWHPGRRALVVVELKTSIVDVQETLGTLDRKRRLALRIARERGWEPLVVGAWLVVSDTRTNRRRVAAHATVLRAALPVDGRGVKTWLRRPSRPLGALTFLPVPAVSRASGRSSRVTVHRSTEPHAHEST